MPYNIELSRRSVLARQSGSAIIILFVAIALMGALAYAFSSSSRTSVGWFQKERDKASQTASADCQLAISSATKRLSMRGCDGMISSLADGSNPNPNAPTDGSCSLYHPNGGGVKTCTGIATGGTDACAGTPTSGTICADGSVYAGLSPDGNIKMYATPADAPGIYPWNNGAASGHINSAINNCTTISPGGTSGCRTGKSNTDTLATTDSDNATGGIQPHQAALYCYNLTAYGHDDWYLPASDELNVLFVNRNQGAFNGSFDLSGVIPLGYYISSSEHSMTTARRQRFSDGSQFGNVKENPMSVRCVRKQ